MAERRMFTQKIVDSDAFLDMPLSTQALYFHLNMRADDDGFVNNPKKVQRMIGASEDDLKLLIAKRFLIHFENGIVVIKHWRMHNLLRKDRYTETQYIEQKNMLLIKGNGVYTEADSSLVNQMATICQPNGNQMATQGSIDKYSIDKYRVVECSGNGNQECDSDNGENVDNSVDNSILEYVGGTLGKGVVLLTEEQIGVLLDELGLSAFNYYIDKLSTFIIDNDAKVGNHYKTILKWHEEDKKV
jgi:hypothetical protein